MKMKKISLLFLCTAIVFVACKKNKLDDVNQLLDSDQTNNANVKFIHTFASITPALTTGAGPNIFMYQNGKKLNGSTTGSSSLVYGGISPLTTSYSLIPFGPIYFQGIMARVAGSIPAPIAGDTVFTASQGLISGKYYSLFLTDTVPTPSIKVVEDDMSLPDTGKYKIRFGNFISNPTESYSVWSRREGKLILDNISYKTVSNFISLAIPIGLDTFDLRKVGTTVNISSINSFSPVQQRIYTLFSRGKTGISTRALTLSFYTNR